MLKPTDTPNYTTSMNFLSIHFVHYASMNLSTDKPSDTMSETISAAVKACVGFGNSDGQALSLSGHF